MPTNTNVFGAPPAYPSDVLYAADVAAKLTAPVVVYGSGTSLAATNAAAAEPYVSPRVLLGYTSSPNPSLLLWPLNYVAPNRFTVEIGFRLRDAAYAGVQVGVAVYSASGSLTAIAFLAPLDAVTAQLAAKYIETATVVATDTVPAQAGLGRMWRGVFDFESLAPITSAPAWLVDARLSGGMAAAAESEIHTTRTNVEGAPTLGTAWAGKTLNRIGIVIAAPGDGAATARTIDIFDMVVRKHPKDR